MPSLLLSCKSFLSLWYPRPLFWSTFSQEFSWHSGSPLCTEQWGFCLSFIFRGVWIIFQNNHHSFRSQQRTQEGQILCHNLCYLAFYVVLCSQFTQLYCIPLECHTVSLVLIILYNFVASAVFLAPCNSFLDLSWITWTNRPHCGALGQPLTTFDTF